MSWLTGVGAAISIKLSSSIDDVVWLAPFLASNTSHGARMKNAMIYISVCLTQTVVAMAIAYSGDSLVSLVTRNVGHAWSTDKILTVFAGSMLALYAVKLTKEYIQEMNDDSASEDDGRELPEAQMRTDEEAARPLSSHGATSDVEHHSQDLKLMHDQTVHEAKQSQTLFVIAFLGSVDDLTLFVPMLVGKGFDMVQLVVGGFVAATAIVLLCCFLGLCKPVADCLSRVPLAAIVTVFSVTLLIKACTMA